MKRVLIYTDVILDFFFDREPFCTMLEKFCHYVNPEELKVSSLW